MYEIRKHGYAENIRVMRESTAARIHEKKTWTDDDVLCLRHMFYFYEGISHMALLFGCTEIEIMNKILELNLYGSFSFPIFWNYLGDTLNSPEKQIKGGFNCDPYTQNVEIMRRATCTFSEREYDWTRDHDEVLRQMLESNADITTIALSFVCTEVMIMRKIMELGLYEDSEFGSDMGPFADTVVYYPCLHDCNNCCSW